MTIVSIAFVYTKGRNAALRGDSRDSHGMNWFVPALPHWLEGFDSVRQKHASPASHTAPAGRQRIDARQAVV